MSAATASPQPAILRGQGLPDFAAITPDAVDSHIPGLIETLEAELTALEQGLSARLAALETEGGLLAWQELMDPLQQLRLQAAK